MPVRPMSWRDVVTHHPTRGARVSGYGGIGNRSLLDGQRRRERENRGRQGGGRGGGDGGTDDGDDPRTVDEMLANLDLSDEGRRQVEEDETGGGRSFWDRAGGAVMGVLESLDKPRSAVAAVASEAQAAIPGRGAQGAVSAVTGEDGEVATSPGEALGSMASDVASKTGRNISSVEAAMGDREDYEQFREDSGWQGAALTLAGDIATDPLNYVGVGLADEPARIGRALTRQGGRAARELGEEGARQASSRVLRHRSDAFLSAREASAASGGGRAPSVVFKTPGTGLPGRVLGIDRAMRRMTGGRMPRRQTVIERGTRAGEAVATARRGARAPLNAALNSRVGAAAARRGFQGSKPFLREDLRSGDPQRSYNALWTLTKEAEARALEKRLFEESNKRLKPLLKQSKGQNITGEDLFFALGGDEQSLSELGPELSGEYRAFFDDLRVRVNDVAGREVVRHHSDYTPRFLTDEAQARNAARRAGQDPRTATIAHGRKYGTGAGEQDDLMGHKILPIDEAGGRGQERQVKDIFRMEGVESTGAGWMKSDGYEAFPDAVRVAAHVASKEWLATQLSNLGVGVDLTTARMTDTPTASVAAQMAQERAIREGRVPTDEVLDGGTEYRIKFDASTRQITAEADAWADDPRSPRDVLSDELKTAQQEAEVSAREHMDLTARQAELLDTRDELMRRQARAWQAFGERVDDQRSRNALDEELDDLRTQFGEVDDALDQMIDVDPSILTEKVAKIDVRLHELNDMRDRALNTALEADDPVAYDQAVSTLRYVEANEAAGKTRRKALLATRDNAARDIAERGGRDATWAAGERQRVVNQLYEYSQASAQFGHDELAQEYLELSQRVPALGGEWTYTQGQASAASVTGTGSRTFESMLGATAFDMSAPGAAQQYQWRVHNPKAYLPGDSPLKEGVNVAWREGSLSPDDAQAALGLHVGDGLDEEMARVVEMVSGGAEPVSAMAHTVNLPDGEVVAALENFLTVGAKRQVAESLREMLAAQGHDGILTPNGGRWTATALDNATFKTEAGEAFPTELWNAHEEVVDMMTGRPELEADLDAVERDIAHLGPSLHDAHELQTRNERRVRQLQERLFNHEAEAAPELQLRQAASRMRAEAGEAQASAVSGGDPIVDKNRATVANLEAKALQGEADMSTRPQMEWETARKALSKKESEQALQEVLRDGYRQFGQHSAMPEHVAESLTRSDRFNEPEALRKVLKVHDKALNLWKSYAILTPGFHWRNTFGGVWNNWMADMDEARYSQFERAHRAFQKGRLADSGLDQEVQDAYMAANEAGMLTGGQSVGELDNALGAGWSANPLSSNFVAPRAGRAVGNAVENRLRGSLYMDEYIKSGGDTTEAFAKVMKFHFDYDDLSGLERSVFRRVIPFYTWNRRNLPLQLEMIARNPGKINRYFQVKSEVEEMSDEEGIVPEYMRDRAAIRLPWATDGGQIYAMPDLPLMSLMEASDRDQMMGMVSPFIKTPYEFYAQRRVWKGVPLESQYEPMPGAWGAVPGLVPALRGMGVVREGRDGRPMMRQRDAYALEQFMPTFGQARRNLPSPEDEDFSDRRMTSWMSWGLGLGVRTNTDREQRNELWSRYFDLQDQIEEHESLGYGPDESELLSLGVIDRDMLPEEPRESGD